MVEFRWLLLAVLLLPFRGNSLGRGDSTGKRMPRIGVVFPLSGSGADKARTETVLEFYKGMVLANEICTALDSGLEFHLFDHQNRIQELQRLDREGCFGGLDMLVGPARQAMLPALDSLAALRNIPLMNVLTHTTAGPFRSALFSQQASVKAIARTAFNVLSPLSGGKKAGIVYGTEKTDSLLADAFRRICQAEGKQVVLFRKVGKNSAANLSKYLTEAGLDSTSCLFVPNNENLVRVQLLSAYGILQAKFPVMIYGKWLESPAAEPDDYASLPFFFAGPDLPDPLLPVKKTWESNFIARWGNPPGWIAWKGFDLAMLLSKKWYASKTGGFTIDDFSSGSGLFGGYRFDKGMPENQAVPVYRIEKTGLLRYQP